MMPPLTSAGERLAAYLAGSGRGARITPLTPDASTREYFRIEWDGPSRVACVYPEPFGEDLPYLDTTRLFEAAGLPVAEIVAVDAAAGIVIQEDLGSRSLAEELASAGAAQGESRIDQAIALIADIQAATSLAFETSSAASRLRFDKEKLGWELGFFLEHYFGSLLGTPLRKSLEQAVLREFDELSETLEARSKVLTHRDYHAANLMVGSDGRLRIIDHQDSRIGSAAYDLVSLLLDRITEQPDREWIADKRSLLLRLRAAKGLEPIGPDAFAEEFELVSVQRCLKAAGTFSNQAANFGRGHYTRFIPSMFESAAAACERLNRFPAVREMILTGGGQFQS